MTAREMKLMMIVGSVVVVAVLYNVLSPMFSQMDESGSSNVSQDEAFRVLRSEENIKARNKAALSRYRQLADRFYFLRNQSQAELDILEVVEDIAAQSRLNITLKNPVQLSPTELGVSLEGDTSAEVLIRFMHQLTQGPVCLTIKRLQLRGVLEKRMLSYQMVVSVLMVK